MNANQWNWPGARGILTIFVVGLGCVATAMAPPDAGNDTAKNATAKANTIIAPPPFDRWPKKKPDLAIIVTGQQHSYLKFCGCSVPQLGGFERRSNFINQLKQMGWPVIALDLGDIVYRKPGAVQAQTLLKYKTAMQALQMLGYSAMGLGENEFNLPLLDGLTQFTLQHPEAKPRILAANLKDRDLNFPSGDGRGSMIGDVVIIAEEGNRPKVGVLALVGPTVQEKIADPMHKFAENNKTVINSALTAFTKADVALRVLLYQGEPQEAEALAKAIPDFHLIVCKCPTEEPPMLPVIIEKTMIVMIGHKGRHVGIVGVFRNPENPKRFELHWEKVALTDTYETPDAMVATHPMVKLMEEYSQQVKDQNLLLQYPKVPHPVKVKYPNKKVEFVGSQKCQQCHQEDYEIWKKSGHAHAYDALVNIAKKPSLRQFDGECIVCHTVGFGYASGYKSEQLTPHLKDVGCENCHGPGSLHVAEPNNRLFHGDLSPWKTKPDDLLMKVDGKYDEAVLLKVDQGVCFKCHDTDNDPAFRFENFWPKIAHGKKAAGGAASSAASSQKKR